MNENKQTTEALDDILAEMRNAAKDSYAEKTAKRLEDHEATGTRDALDINDAIQCLRDDDKYLLDLADRLEAVVNRMRDAYCDLCKEKDAAYDRLLLERDKAIQTSASGNVATMRKALERILDIEGYGAPWLEAKVIAQKALEGQQCTPPVAQEKPKIEQPGGIATMRAALEEQLRYWNSHVRTHDEEEMRKRTEAALSAPARNADRFATFGEAQAEFDRTHEVLKFSYYELHKWLFAPIKENGGKKQ